MKKLELEYVGKLLRTMDRLNDDYYDKQGAHIEADEILCNLLEELGFKEVVRLYREIPKWYA